MSENSKIEWTDHTFNPWEGCQKIGPGCDHCYAEARNARFAGGTSINWGPGSPRRRTSASNWRKPFQWNKAHPEFFAAHGRRQRVFCASLADVFDNEVDPVWRRDLFDLIELTPNLDWLLLTKRIGNVFEMVARTRSHDWLAGRDNVWLGATICNQAEADRDIPKLLEVPARLRFLSMEPLLGPVDLTSIPWGGRRVSVLQGWNDPAHGLHWVICGGESGHGARPMHPAWPLALRDQCVAADVPFLFKQWGEWQQTDAMPGGDLGGDMRRSDVRIIKPAGENDGHFRRGDVLMRRVGKKISGRQLDGRTYDGFPRGAP